MFDVSPRRSIAKAGRCFLQVILLIALVPLSALAQHQWPITDPKHAADTGKDIAAQVLSQPPEKPLISGGTLTIRDANHKETIIPVRFRVLPGDTAWTNIYEAGPTNGQGDSVLCIIHKPDAACEYRLQTRPPGSTNADWTTLTGNESMIPFAGSDFWLVDLGLDFFRWPKQVLLGREVRSSRSCYVLESTNPNPSPRAYSRVDSWLDVETLLDTGQGAIIHAEAYDADGKLLKEFLPKDVEKVNGVWQLKEMEMDNDQTRSRTRIVFDLGTK